MKPKSFYTFGSIKNKYSNIKILSEKTHEFQKKSEKNISFCGYENPNPPKFKFVPIEFKSKRNDQIDTKQESTDKELYNVRVPNVFLKYFVEKRKYAALQLLITIRHKFNNHLHSNEIPQLGKYLGMKPNAVRRNLRTLVNESFAIKHSKDYWRFISLNKIASRIHPDANLNNQQFFRKSSYISFHELQDRKTFNRLFYVSIYVDGYNLTKKNLNKNERLTKHDRKSINSTSRFEKVSSSFVRNVSRTKIAKETILKNLSNIQDLGYIEVHRKYIVLNSFKSSNMHSAMKVAKELNAKLWYCRKKHQYQIRQYLTNLVRPKLRFL